MRREDVKAALNNAESFTEAVLVRIVGFPPPFTFVAVAVVVVGAWALGKFL